jgi:hypothetical protein
MITFRSRNGTPCLNQTAACSSWRPCDHRCSRTTAGSTQSCDPHPYNAPPHPKPTNNPSLQEAAKLLLPATPAPFQAHQKKRYTMLVRSTAEASAPRARCCPGPLSVTPFAAASGLLPVQARGPLSTPTSRRAGQHWSTAPTLQKPCLSRSVLAPSAGLDRKKLMSFLCSKVHGNKQQQAGVGAAPEDSLPASSMAQSPEPIAAAAVEPAAVEAPPAAVPEVPEAPSSPAVASQQTGAKFGQAYIKVVGCGGGGGNAISRMISAGLQVSERLIGGLPRQLVWPGLLTPPPRAASCVAVSHHLACCVEVDALEFKRQPHQSTTLCVPALHHMPADLSQCCRTLSFGRSTQTLRCAGQPPIWQLVSAQLLLPAS